MHTQGSDAARAATRGVFEEASQACADPLLRLGVVHNILLYLVETAQWERARGLLLVETERVQGHAQEGMEAAQLMLHLWGTLRSGEKDTASGMPCPG